jgi:DNA-binding MarR family transcriptional regulator
MASDVTEQAAAKLISALAQFHHLYHIGGGMSRASREPISCGNSSYHMRSSEMMLLFTIRNAMQHSPDGVSATELSREMDVKPPTINPLLANLESKDMIRRVTDSSDRRYVRITLSKTGARFTAMCEKKMSDRIRGLIAYLGVEKSNELADLMSEVYQYFSKQKENNPYLDSKDGEG